MRRLRAVLRRPGAGTLLLSVLALAAALAVRVPHAPPLYDGIGFPDEPYRWVGPQAVGTGTAAPTTMTVTVDLTSAKPTLGLTAEQGPQLAVQLVGTDLQGPAGAGTVTIVATPRPAPPPPPNGTIASDLYTFTLTADRPGAVTPKPGTRWPINLRADAATSQAVVVEAWDGSAWHQTGCQVVSQAP